jgi:TrmH family RNA methyltransferase
VTPAGRTAQRPRPLARDEAITSRENQWLKRFRGALRAGEAAEDGLVGLEGPRLVEEALRSGLGVEALLVTPAGERHFERLRPLAGDSLRVLRTSDRLFASAAGTETPHGIAALVHPRAASFDDLVRGVPLVVVLVGVQDPGNVGTVVRAAEAFGATGVATCASPSCGTAHPFSPKALRASAGSALRLPVVHGLKVPILLAQLHVVGVKLYAAAPDTEVDAPRAARPIQPVLNPWQADFRAPTALLVGNEGAGLPPEVVRSADVRVRIPIEGRVESLNAAVAASVLLYEAARQRRAAAGAQR